jgi:hypothetical protein
MGSFDDALAFLINRFAVVRAIPPEIDFQKQTNPFNRFILKSATLTEPAPLLRAFIWALIQAARLFAAKPIHAAAFHRLGFLIARSLKSTNLVLTLCQESHAILQPILANPFHSKWTIQPLLYILSALSDNKETKSNELHQSLLAKTAFILDNLFVSFYQERALSQSIVTSVLDSPPNVFRSAFLLFAAKVQLLDVPTGDVTLPLLAADLFRNSPERCYDDLVGRFRSDPLFAPAAVYVICCAHNVGLSVQGSIWSAQALDLLKTQLHEPEEKQPKKSNPRDSKQRKSKPTPVAKTTVKLEPTRDATEDAAENAAAQRIQLHWNRYRARTRGCAKYV